jgi:hypothetical protein
MFNAFASTTDDLRRIESDRKVRVLEYVEQLKSMGLENDIPLLFSRGQWLPDWEIAETYPDAVQKIVGEIYRRGQERKHAEDELALRRWPN